MEVLACNGIYCRAVVNQHRNVAIGQPVLHLRATVGVGYRYRRTKQVAIGDDAHVGAINVQRSIFIGAIVIAINGYRNVHRVAAAKTGKVVVGVEARAAEVDRARGIKRRLEGLNGRVQIALANVANNYRHRGRVATLRQRSRYRCRRYRNVGRTGTLAFKANAQRTAVGAENLQR